MELTLEQKIAEVNRILKYPSLGMLCLRLNVIDIYDINPSSEYPEYIRLGFPEWYNAISEMGIRYDTGSESTYIYGRYIQWSQDVDRNVIRRKTLLKLLKELKLKAKQNENT